MKNWLKAVFTSKSKILSRINSLEETLGVHYVVDNDGYAEHIIRGVEQSYHVLSGLVKDVESITKKGKK